MLSKLPLRSLCLAATLLAVPITFAQEKAPAQEKTTAEERPPLPKVAREFRGVWVATVANIDWPSKPGLSTERQKAEAIAILDRVQECGMNVVILQVRPAADALYKSDIEPWSYYLTGEQGKAPEPFYDPLEFWVSQAHARGLELHAWLNPFRVLPNGKPFELSDDSIAKKNPDAVVEYGNKSRDQLWMDPANDDARQQTLDVFADITTRYDLDGLHMDDYFYPYPVGDLPFPDEASYKKYQQDGGDLKLHDFRRDNVNKLVREIFEQTKKEKPYVKFGISPFGIWRPGNPPSVQGFDQYDNLYADAKLWLNEGWCDYFTPQLYWPIAAPQQSYPALMHWWASQNTKDRTLAPGLYTGRVGRGQKDWPVDEVAGQIYVTRYSGVADGNVHFSMKWIMGDIKGIGTEMRDTIYAEPALVPAMPWADDDAPDAPTNVRMAQITPQVTTKEKSLPDGEWFKPLKEKESPKWNNYVRVSWKDDQKDAKVHVVQALRGNAWETHIVPGAEDGLSLGEMNDNPILAVAVSTVDRAGNQSDPATYDRPGVAGETE